MFLEPVSQVGEEDDGNDDAANCKVVWAKSLYDFLV